MNTNLLSSHPDHHSLLAAHLPAVLIAFVHFPMVAEWAVGVAINVAKVTVQRVDIQVDNLEKNKSISMAS